MQRVKVYQLNSTGTWDDKGTGHVLVERNRRMVDAKEPAVVDQLEARSPKEWGNPVEQFQVSLKVTSEEVPTQVLLHHDVSTDITYQLQGGTLWALRFMSCLQNDPLIITLLIFFYECRGHDHHVD